MSDSTTPALYFCDHLAVARVTGDEAEKFLQGQLTTDLRHLAPGDNRLAMHLDLKGRATVSMRLFRTADGYDLVMPAALRESGLNGLKKYALFSKTELQADDSRRVLGFVDHDQAVAFDGLALHGPGEPRWMALVDRADPRLPEAASAGSAAQWQILDIRAGMAHVYPGGEGLWLPQALNYDLMDGVHFNKGCFLGQEVVARMHFKGQMKQRMRRWQWPGEQIPEVGAALRNTEDKAVGELVHAVAENGLVNALVVTRLDHQGDLFVDGQALNAEELALPYRLPEAG